MESASRLHFGTLLRQFRFDAGLTQLKLAERAELSVEAIGALERGARTRPYKETVDLLARALELSPERKALLEGAMDVARPPQRRRGIDDPKPSLLRIVHTDAHLARRHNLPHQMTSFVGRQREVADLTALLREHRIVTIVGAGGVGKTRVAVHAGGELLDGYPDGVWLVDLAPLADQTLVASAVLSALQFPSTTGSALDIVLGYLEKRTLLLILDNCEHVIAEARQVAASIIQSCPYARILSTSREALEIAGERVYRLPSLAIPDSRESAQNVLSSSDAVALFVDRALAVDAMFSLTDDNAKDVAEICRRLDGIPLAIELAAARVRALAPRHIAKRLDQQFRLLTGGDPRDLPRHQTMTALIDWSYDLLTPREQTFFESLSVFAGGCTLEAAAAVCAIDGEDDFDVIDLIESLVTKSMLVAELAGSDQRYYLLESSRQYARNKLTARGSQEQVARRHALVYLDLAEQRERAWSTTPELLWFSQATLELENWRAVLEWALARRGDVVLGQRLAALRMVIQHSFPDGETRRWVGAALDLVDELTPTSLVARLEHAEAESAQNIGQHKTALVAAQQALVRYCELGDVLAVAQTQTLVGGSLPTLGRTAEAETLLQEALGTARALGDRRLVAEVLQNLAVARTVAGDFAGARVCLAEALGIAKVLGAELLEASIAVTLADHEYDAGNPETALRLITDVLATYRSLSYSTSRGITIALGLMVIFLVALGRYDEARMHANEALQRARELRMEAVVVISLQHLALVPILRPRVERRSMSSQYASVARLLGFADARLTSLGFSEVYVLHHRYDRALAELRDSVGAQDLVQLMAAGATMTEDEALEQARGLD